MFGNGNYRPPEDWKGWLVIGGLVAIVQGITVALYYLFAP